MADTTRSASYFMDPSQFLPGSTNKGTPNPAPFSGTNEDYGGNEFVRILEIKLSVTTFRSNEHGIRYVLSLLKGPAFRLCVSRVPPNLSDDTCVRTFHEIEDMMELIKGFAQANTEGEALTAVRQLRQGPNQTFGSLYLRFMAYRKGVPAPAPFSGIDRDYGVNELVRSLEPKLAVTTFLELVHTCIGVGQAPRPAASYLRTTFRTDEDEMQYVLSLLRGPAWRLCTPRVPSNPGTGTSVRPFHEIEDMIKELIERFGQTNTEGERRSSTSQHMSMRAGNMCSLGVLHCSRKCKPSRKLCRRCVSSAKVPTRFSAVSICALRFMEYHGSGTSISL